MAAAPLEALPKSSLDRFLSLFADVRHGESGRLLLLAFNVFLILTAYYVMKPVREALILSQPGGAEIKSYSMALQALLLAFAVPAYGALANLLPRRRLINIVTAFFVACLPLFFLAAEQRWRVGVPFFLWIGIFSLMVITQFWAYANDIYSAEEGKRLFALIAFGASSGAVFGAFISGQLIGVLGVNAMLLVAAVILAVSLIVFNIIDVREDSAGARRSKAVEVPIGHGSTFGLVMRNRYLLLIAALVLLLNWVNATGEYILSSIVQRAAEEEVAAGALTREQQSAYIGTFFSQYFQVVNVAGMMLQLFVVSRIIKYARGPAGRVHTADRCARQLCGRGGVAVARRDAMGQDGRKLGRLLAAEHSQADAVSADDP